MYVKETNPDEIPRSSACETVSPFVSQFSCPPVTQNFTEVSRRKATTSALGDHHVVLETHTQIFFNRSRFLGKLQQKPPPTHDGKSCEFACLRVCVQCMYVCVCACASVVSDICIGWPFSLRLRCNDVSERPNTNALSTSTKERSHKQAHSKQTTNTRKHTSTHMHRDVEISFCLVVCALVCFVSFAPPDCTRYEHRIISFNFHTHQRAVCCCSLCSLPTTQSPLLTHERHSQLLARLHMSFGANHTQ